MLQHRTPIWFTMILCAIVSVCDAKPLKEYGQQEAYTYYDYFDQMLSWHKQVMVEAYLAHGRRSPDWDDLAVDLLNAQAMHWTNRTINVAKYHRPAEAIEPLQAKAKLLLERGCDDPMVLYAAGKTWPGSEIEQTKEIFRRAHEGFEQSEYDPICKAWGAGAAINGLDDNDPRRQELAQLRRDYLVRVFLARDRNPFLVRYLHDYLSIDDFQFEEIEAWHDAAQQFDDPDPYAYHLLCGYHHVEAAWNARGGEWANTVTQEGWRGFAEHLDKAREHLVQAWQLHPAHPLAARKMVAVAMGQNVGHQEQRLWFERAIEAQFDYAPAYDALTWAMRPRWGGSHAMMLQFAHECLDTERYDTIVPPYVYDVMCDIRSDYSGRDGWWKHSEQTLYPMVVRLYDEAAKRNAPGDTPQWYRSMRGAAAWRFEHYDEAKQVLQELGDELRDDAFKKFDGDAPLARSEIYARTGAMAELLAQADHIRVPAALSTKLQEVKAALAQQPQDDPARLYVKNWLVCRERRLKFEQGDWVALIDRDAGLAGWRPLWGKWSIGEQGELIGRPNNYEMMIASAVGFGTRMEMRGRFRVESPQAQDYPQFINGGLVVEIHKPRSTYHHHDVLFFPFDQRVRVVRNARYAPTDFQHELTQPIEFHFQMWDQRLSLTANGQLIFQDHRLERDFEDEQQAVGIGSIRCMNSSTLIFEQLEIRRLTNEPQWDQLVH